MNEVQTTEENVKFARYIFAIGGAGKNLVYTMLEKDWILQELLKPKHTASDCDITIIDTALDEENDDRDRIEKINNKIREIEVKNRNNPDYLNKNAGRITINYMLLTKDMILQSPFDLVGIGKEVKDATGASVWWINDPSLGTDWHKKVINRQNFKEMSFAKGVYRKRAIGKAIYYKALSKGLFNIGLLQTAQIDIIVGLGGGTGSGMALDLARKLKSIRPTAEITLFGILSTLFESTDEKANSFAMLSELEYDRLNGDKLFKDMILVPMEVTQFPGMQRCDDTKKRLLLEFDETFPYMLMAYHNSTQSLFTEGIVDFAPFTVMTSQMVKYNVEAIKKLKESVDESLVSKETSLKNEEIVYSYIRKFIEEYKDRIPESESGQLQLSNDDKQFLIDDRFNKFKMVAGHPFFKELEYNSVKSLDGDIKTGIASAGSDEIEKQISSIKSEIDANVSAKTYRDTTDEQLYKVLKSDIETIEVLMQTLSLINKVPDKLIVDTLKCIVKMDEENLGRMLNKVRDKSQSLSSEKSSLERIVKGLNDELQNYEEKIKTEVESQIQKWIQSETKNIDLINSVDDSSPILYNDFISLRNELDGFATEVNKENNIKALEAKPTKSIEVLLDKIYLELEKIGVYYQDKSNILKSMNILKDLRKTQIESRRKVGILDRTFKTGKLKKIKEAKSKTILKTAELHEYKVFEVRESISCIYTYSIQENLNQRKDEIISTIIKRTRDNFQNASQPLFTELKDTLTTSEQHKEISKQIRAITLSHLGYEVDINKIDSELKSKNELLAETVKNLNILQTLDSTIMKNIRDVLGKHSQFLKSYINTIESIEKQVRVMRDSRKGEVRYVMEIQPENIYKATARGANINNILEDIQERSSIKKLLRDGINRAMDNNYNMLVQSVIENNDYTKRWDKTKIINCLVTIANHVDTKFVDTRTDILNTFSVDTLKYSEAAYRIGEQWEVGIVLFIAGVPLDNVRSIVDARAGYYRSYTERAKSGSIFFHHSLLLEQGRFVKRSKVFNFTEEKDKICLLDDDEEGVKNLFANNYDEVDLKTVMSPQSTKGKSGKPVIDVVPVGTDTDTDNLIEK